MRAHRATSRFIGKSIATPTEVAVEAAQAAGDVLGSYADKPIEVHEKHRRADLVTDADRASERVIFEMLRAAFPNATLYGEESGTHAGTSQERWIVDPLDGTTNYAHGYPLYCVSIAFERDGELLAGVIYAPAMNEWFVAERGAGATCNERRIGVSAIAELGQALTCTGFHPADFERNARCFAAMSARAQAVRRDGSAALDLAYTAMGRFDGFWEFDLHAWDVAAGTLIVREAGGTVTRTDGSPSNLEARSILATNGRIHAEMVHALR